MIKLESISKIARYGIKTNSYALDSTSFEYLVGNKFNIGYNLLKNGKALYRGSNYSKDILLINPKQFTRVSKDSANIYYVLFDNLPSWKNYPKRSNSLIFSGNYDTANQYGSLNFYVIPVNNAKIVVANMFNDFVAMPNISKKFHIKDISSFIINVLISTFDSIYRFEGTMYYMNLTHIKTNEYEDFINYVNKTIIPYIKKLEIPPDYLSKRSGIFYDDCVTLINDLKNISDIESYLDELLNPKLNNIYYDTTENVINKYGSTNESVEMWTDSPCIIVKKDFYDIRKHNLI